MKLWITLLLVAPMAAVGQTYSGAGNAHEVFVGSETEQYLRYLSVAGLANGSPWSIRPLSPTQVAAMGVDTASHPWGSRLTGFARPSSLVELRLLSPNASERFNSEFPYGSNDGAIWAGRGLTFAAQAGVYARIGPLSLTLLPTVFRAENSGFVLAPSSLPCGCGQPVYDNNIDRPQQFGTAAYQRVDPGQSSIQLDLVGVSAGVSTANEGWGPSTEFPFLLGNNAPGFPHVFIGSSRPFPILIGRMHLRVIYGRLDQSDYSPVTGPKYYASRLQTGRVRFASGFIGSFQPRGIDGLEIGAARFIHSIWPRTGIPRSYLRKPLRAFLKSELGTSFDTQIAGSDNELASAFARWAFAGAGLEVYGEYGRDDHNYDLRDLLQEPDHQRVYSLGLAKTFRSTTSQFNVLRLELMNFELPSLATTTRGEGTIYLHSISRQGHTNRGQLLGADIGVGAAAASTVRWDHYSTRGRWGFFWHRDVRQETGDPNLNGPSIRQDSDVIQALGFDKLTFTKRFDITTSLTLMRDFDRNFDHSLSNINAAVAITLPR
ncbi:MAG TPA: capsule assembly Wzi family protein [Gemmatimonadaceae bacterium]|nr:capsule assembly Wzi family protein [Gemmatimonadaceae bacterium]